MVSCSRQLCLRRGCCAYPTICQQGDELRIAERLLKSQEVHTKRERDTEHFLKMRAHTLGGVSLKMICKGMAGSPDQWVFFPPNEGSLLPRIGLAETKHPGKTGRDRPTQVLFKRMLAPMGVLVRRVGTEAEAVRFLADVLALR